MAKEKKAAPSPVVQEGDLHELLQEYREKAGYSLSQMADALCLSEETIKNLEDENFKALAVPPYVRGYLRNYAKMAEKDPEELISRYESLRGADPKELEHHFKVSPGIDNLSKKRLSPILIQVMFLGLLLAIIAGIFMIPSVNKWIKTTWQNLSSQSSSPSIDSTDNPVLTGTMPIPTPLTLDKNEKSTVENTSDKKEQTTAENTSKAPNSADEKEATNKTASKTDGSEEAADQTAKKEDAKTKEEPKDSETSKTSEDTPKPPGSIISIKLVFNKEVWMRIKDEKNKTVFEGQNSAGKEKVLELKKPVTFRVGNAQGLSLFVDGKAVDISSYTKGSVANFTLE